MSPKFSVEQLTGLCDIAIKAAQQAGQWIEKVDHNTLQRNFKNVGSNEASQLVTEVDIASEDIIRRFLQKLPGQLDIAFVGEESASSNCNHVQERFEKPWFWCVDPLDGTLAFVEGRPGYAVSIALVEKSGKPLIGVVYDPARQTLYHAILGQGSYCDLRPFSRIEESQETSKVLTVYADASFKTHARYEMAVKALENCAHALDFNDLTFSYGNGAVKNACDVLGSTNACYLKLPKKEDGGGSIWDYAATSCIAHESGAWVSDSYGQILALNRRDSTFMNHKGILFASNTLLAKCIIDALWHS